MSEPSSLEPRMLERRISNNRADLNNDQQMNFLITWFNQWSDLQKEDFVPVLGETMSSKHINVNGLTESFSFLANTCDGRRRPSLFSCQVSLYRGWVNSWSDDQKNYLILRLKELDGSFAKKYEQFILYGADSPDKDYFEPGIPPELDLSNSNPASLNTSIDETALHYDKKTAGQVSIKDENNSVEDEVTTSKDDVSSEKDEHDDQDSLEDDDHDLAKQYGDDDSQALQKEGWVDPLQPLSTINEEYSLES